MKITLLLNDPPGGRCRLYQAYATALIEHAAAKCAELFNHLPEQPQVRAPAILINGLQVMPADGVIISPQDIGQILGTDHPNTQLLEAILDGVREHCMQEWG